MRKLSFFDAFSTLESLKMTYMRFRALTLKLYFRVTRDFRQQYHETCVFARMKVDIFQHSGFKLPKNPHFDLARYNFSLPFSSTLKYEKIKRKSQKHTISLQIQYFIKNWGCYSKIEYAKSLDIFMLNKLVTSEF